MRILSYLSLLIASTVAIPTAELGETAGPCDSDVTGKPCGPVDGYVGKCIIALRSLQFRTAEKDKLDLLLMLCPFPIFFSFYRK